MAQECPVSIKKHQHFISTGKHGYQIYLEAKGVCSGKLGYPLELKEIQFVLLQNGQIKSKGLYQSGTWSDLTKRIVLKYPQKKSISGLVKLPSYYLDIDLKQELLRGPWGFYLPL